MNSASSESPKRGLPPLAAVVLMIGLHLLLPVRQLISVPYRLFGLIPLAAGLVAVLSVAASFKRAGTTIKPFETSSTLVDRGLYRFTRNPIYLGMVCGLVGVGVPAGSVTPFLVVPAFAWPIDRRFIRVEEAMYTAYKARVRRWL